MNRFILVIFPFVLVFLSSCQSRQVAEQSYMIHAAEWTYDNVLPFEFSIADTASDYRLMLTLKYARDYAYENLYTRVTTTYPDGTVNAEPLSIQLADRTGHWYGKCGRTFCRLTLPLQEKIRFRQSGTYQIRFEQYMRDNPVRGIRSLQFILEKRHG